MFGIKTRLQKAIRNTALPDLLVRLFEQHQGIRYPTNLIGRRNVPPQADHRGGALVIAAHPDDETLGLGYTLIKHRADNDVVTVVFTTNGAGGNWRDSTASQEELCTTRFLEACDALGTIRIERTHVVSLGFPDGGLHRYIPEAITDVASLLDKLHPTVVYTHAIEGGHPDHDMTSFVTQEACTRTGFSNVYEWAEYNRDSLIGRLGAEALFPVDPYVAEFECRRTPVVEQDTHVKHTMLSKYPSQARFIELYPFRDEILRRAEPTHLLPRLAYFTRLSIGRLRFLCGRTTGAELVRTFLNSTELSA